MRACRSRCRPRHDAHRPRATGARRARQRALHARAVGGDGGRAEAGTTPAGIRRPRSRPSSSTGSFGLERGFATYDDGVESLRDPMRWEMPRRPGPEVTDRALAWLDTRRRARPSSSGSHYYDVHRRGGLRRPTTRWPTPMTVRSPRRCRGGPVARWRRRAAGGRPTLIIVVGDHGEGLGRARRGDTWHAGVRRHAPRAADRCGARLRQAGTRSRAFVRTADVAPTILAARACRPSRRRAGRPLHAAGDAVPSRPLRTRSARLVRVLRPAERLGWGGAERRARRTMEVHGGAGTG